MRLPALVPVALACTLLIGCAKPLPPEKGAYAGDWVAVGMRLTIGQDGKVNYSRQDGSGSAKISAPIKQFDGNNMIVGVGPMATTFVVSTPPHENEGVWKMTVDGVELTRH